MKIGLVKYRVVFTPPSEVVARLGLLIPLELDEGVVLAEDVEDAVHLERYAAARVTTHWYMTTFCKISVGVMQRADHEVFASSIG